MTAASLNKTSQYLNDLLEGLNKLPYTWALTPVKGDKRPYRKNWQNEKPISKQLIERDLRNGKAKGYGLRTGIVSGGIIAIDADGHAAHAKILELSGGIPLPETVSFTSNKPGRRQYLLYIPEEYWGKIATKKIAVAWDEKGKAIEFLEFRWNGCQSVLPPSVHPDTGFYRWGNSPSEVEIPVAPMWVIEQTVLESKEPSVPPLLTKSASRNSILTQNAKFDDKDWAISYLNALSIYRADSYDEWLKVGAILHSIDNSLFSDWDNWSRQSSKYKPGECEQKWNSFNVNGNERGKASIGSLTYMAKEDGWINPFLIEFENKLIQIKESIDDDSSQFTKIKELRIKALDFLISNEDWNKLLIKLGLAEISAEKFQKLKETKMGKETNANEEISSVAVINKEEEPTVVKKAVKNEIEEFVNNNSKDKLIKGWEKQFSKSAKNKKKKKKDELPPEDILGAEIGENLFSSLKWDDSNKRWMLYEHEFAGVWSEISETYVEKRVNDSIEAQGIIGYGTNSYIKNIVAKLRYKVYESKWNERDLAEAIPFADCVFNLITNEKEEHNPNNRFTWVLPRNYSILDYSWSTIENWFDEVTYGNQKLKEILVCFAAAMLRGRSDLQKFIHLMGDGGTGKSSYTRLLINLIGKQNVWSGAIEDLRDQHRVIELRNKRLALFPDQEKVLGSLKIFKNITGEDGITGRELYKPSVLFQFYGMVAVTSNGPIFHAPGSSWLSRRLLSMPFDRKPKEIRNLDAEFAPELSAFTNYLLSIPNEEITRVLQGLGKKEATATSWEMLLRTDSVASFVNDMIVYDTNSFTQIGRNKNEWKDREFDPTTSTLYGAYCNHCYESGLQPKSKNTFSSDLQELIKRTLLWEGVEVYRAGSGYTMMRNIRLRNEDEHGTVLESLHELASIDNTTDNTVDNLQTLTEQAFDSSITNTPPLSEINELFNNSLSLGNLADCDNTLNISEEGGLISEPLQTNVGKGFGVIDNVISDVIEAENEPNYILEPTADVENPAELEHPPTEYAIYYQGGRIEYGCQFIQRIGNVCQFTDFDGETIELVVDEYGNFEGGVIVRKFE